MFILSWFLSYFVNFVSTIFTKYLKMILKTFMLCLASKKFLPKWPKKRNLERVCMIHKLQWFVISQLGIIFNLLSFLNLDYDVVDVRSFSPKSEFNLSVGRKLIQHSRPGKRGEENRKLLYLNVSHKTHNFVDEFLLSRHKTDVFSPCILIKCC